MKKSIISCFQVLFLNIAFGQNLNNHWQLGNSDIHFNTNPPTVNTAGVSSQYGTASISDANGDLLFYTDGITIWRKNHTIMQVIDTNGNYASSFEIQQKVIIVPQPNSKRFYVFVTRWEGLLCGGCTYYHKYYYSIVDFTNNPLGEVLNLNTNINYPWYALELNTNMGQGANAPLTCIENNTNDGYWVITHLDNILQAFEITSSGLNLTPIVSNFSPSFSTSSNQNMVYKFSPEGNKLGVLEGNKSLSASHFYTYDFNKATGAFSNKISYSMGQPNFRAYSFEFSNDSQKVYFTNQNLFVKDLTNPTINARIIAPLPTLPTSDPFTSITPNAHLQRDKNGEIILISSSFATVRKIENQNSFANSSISESIINLNTNFNSINSLPQLIPELTLPCPNTLMVSTIVSTGIDTKQAENYIEATNTINSGSGAIYHAGTSVLLKPMFTAKAGATFRAYIEGCTGNFVARQANPKEGKETVTENETEKDTNKEIATVFPNPNNGIFNLLFDSLQNASIEITDLVGFSVYNTLLKDQDNLEINLQNHPKGIYVLKIVVENKLYTKKIIIN